MKKILILITAIALACMLVAAIIYLDLKRYASQPAAQTKDDQKIIVMVEPGYGLVKVAAVLERKGLITAPLKFRWVARIYGLDKGIKAGEYELSSNMTPMQIIETITKGRIRLHRVTIPEGFNAAQIAAAVAQAGFGDAESFLAAARNPDLLKRLSIPADSAEGYLFPDTYLFAKGTGVDKIIETMTAHLMAHITAKWQARADELGFSMHEIVTLASIIEKETANPQERKLISSVFHNRLKKKMRLETDPTVIYGIKAFDGNLTRKHLNTLTPYNTYMISGLPPGPIASPGAAALEAALYPEKTDYLFFVSKNDATHHFSTNLKEHVEAVRKYQLRKNKK